MVGVIDADIRKARTLPAAFYRDAVLFERMRERVLARSWQLVDGAERAAARGSVLPFTLLEGCLDEPRRIAKSHNFGNSDAPKEWTAATDCSNNSRSWRVPRKALQTRQRQI